MSHTSLSTPSDETRDLMAERARWAHGRYAVDRDN
jgi:hypothetical protein